jgi:hypothetical protein
MSVDLSLLDVPPVQPVKDPDAYLQAAVQCHFSPETASRSWFKPAQALDVDPLTEVKIFEDLARFPNIVGERRDVPVGDLAPKGDGPNPPTPLVSKLAVPPVSSCG